MSDEERQGYVETILSATGKLSVLVTDILKLNKLEHQEIISPQVYALDEQLRCCLLDFEEVMDQKALDWEADLEEEVMIQSDEGLLAILWHNLIQNAIKFNPIGGKLYMTLKRQDKYAVVSIQDTGCGMDQETQKRLFERFYQGETSHSREGNGLGMAMVARILKLTGSSLTIDSVVGEGTTITILIPLTKL